MNVTFMLASLADGVFQDGGAMSCPAHALAGQVPEGFTAVLGVYDPLSQRLDLDTGKVVDWQPPKPDGDEFTDHEWDAGTKRWLPVRTLAGLRLDAWKRVKDRRAAELAAPALSTLGFEFTVAKDLDAARSLAAAGKPEHWRAHDNLFYPLTAEQLRQLADEIEARRSAIMGHSWLLQALIELAASPADLDQIDLEAGWP